MRPVRKFRGVEPGFGFDCCHLPPSRTQTTNSPFRSLPCDESVAVCREGQGVHRARGIRKPLAIAAHCGVENDDTIRKGECRRPPVRSDGSNPGPTSITGGVARTPCAVSQFVQRTCPGPKPAHKGGESWANGLERDRLPLVRQLHSCP